MRASHIIFYFDGFETADFPHIKTGISLFRPARFNSSVRANDDKLIADLHAAICAGININIVALRGCELFLFVFRADDLAACVKRICFDL